MSSISVVVPIFNEEGNVANLHKEIVDVCQANNYTFEIIFVDDGSVDQTVQVCKTLNPLKLIRMRRNFGQTAAMDAGIKAAQYDYIVTMDGDGQNDPADIPHMIEYLEQNNLPVGSEPSCVQRLRGTTRLQCTLYRWSLFLWYRHRWLIRDVHDLVH